MIANSLLRLRRQRLSAAASRRWSLLGAVSLLSLSAIGWFSRGDRWKQWEPWELPVAFWAWESSAPRQSDVDAAIGRTKARTLFLRAGQIDVEDGGPRRIRAVDGTMPKNIELHLVYNATRDCLADFETLNPHDVAATITESFAIDSRRAAADHGSIAGVQLDFDVPTRLLREYAWLLRLVRERLPAETKLSITGLSTWMASPSLKEALSEVDFWIPQCYGSAIPDRVERRQPIASPRLVARAVAGAREFGRPFYAGLAAYGYAIHYGRDGSLLALRGDLDPEIVAQTRGLDPVEHKMFDNGGQGETSSGEWRHVYRARSDCVIDGTPVRTGESMLLDVPTSAWLRACARVAREQGGDNLLGLCVFRLPSLDDRTTLSTEEVACALADADPVFSIKIQISAKPRTRRVLVTVENDGPTSSMLGRSAMTLLLKVQPGSVHAVGVAGFAAYETLVDSRGAPTHADDSGPRVCSLRRADLVRLVKSWWPPGARASVEIEYAGEPPPSIQTECLLVTDDGRKVREARTVQINQSSER